MRESCDPVTYKAGVEIWATNWPEEDPTVELRKKCIDLEAEQTAGPYTEGIHADCRRGCENQAGRVNSRCRREGGPRVICDWVGERTQRACDSFCDYLFRR